MIVVYSKKVCPNCIKVKSLLEAKGIKFTEIDVETNAAGRDVVLSHGLRSVPQVFIGEKLIGDFEKTKTWLDERDDELTQLENIISGINL